MLQNKISLEMQLLPYKNGVKLFKPEDKHCSNQSLSESHTFSHILEIPGCIALLNRDSAAQYINDEALLVCGHSSLKQAMGTTIADIAPKEVAQQVMANHQVVANTGYKKIVEEDVILNNEIQFQSLGILLPWYDEEKIIGLLTCNLVLGKHSYANVLSRLMSLGYLNGKENTFSTSSFGFDNVHLTHREKQCLSYFIRGRTSKEIAKLLNLSFRTIEHYLENIKNKFDVSRKSELISLIMDQNQGS